ncbi:MAG: protein translocase subunit SecF [Actinomycetota bacterium]|nr:protein translocase subunit SecF [Actinomycetota bacterium]
MSGILHRLYQGETKIDFLGKKKIWFGISAVLLLLSIGSLATKKLNFGIEFQGGVSIQAPIPEDGPLGDASGPEVTAAISDAFEKFEASAQIQVRTGDDGDRSVLVQTKEISDPKQQTEVVSTVAETVGVEVADTDSQRIGSKWGGEVTEKAIRALIIFMLVVLAFISWRFEWKMAVAAIAAMIHDLTITAGIYSLVGFEVTPSTVIAILTILGYSLYDTVVVFDKLEENTATYAATGRMTYQDSANLAMNEVFMRSLNTSLATLLPVAALLFVGAGALGAETLKDLALALFVGLLAGTYSSIFFATPILAMMKEREPRYRSVREKVLRDAQRAPSGTRLGGGATTPALSATPAGATDSSEVVAPATTHRPAAGVPARRAPAGSKKAKRRKRK